MSGSKDLSFIVDPAQSSGVVACLRMGFDLLTKLEETPLSYREDFNITKKKLRSAHRIQTAIERQRNLEAIHQASESDRNLFYSLIQKQRQSVSTNTKQLVVGNHVFTGELLLGEPFCLPGHTLYK